MKYALDPTRLADQDRDGAHDLGDAIRALRAEAARGSDIDALARRMAPQLSAPAPIGAGAGTGGVAFGVGAKWTAALLIVVAIAVVWYASARRHAISPQVEQRALPASPQPDPTAVPRPALPASEVVVEPMPAAAVENRVPPAAHRRTPARKSAARSAATGAAESELALLERARAALDRDPNATLALSEQHAHVYPRGLFAQEREVLAIEALLKLRRRPAALQRASDFVQRYPDSAHARRVRDLLDRTAHAAPTTRAASDHSATDNPR